MSMRALMQSPATRLRTAGTLLAVFGVLAGATLAPSPALAVCKDPPCVRDPGTTPTPTPTPAPTVTSIRSVAPSCAWRGDTITWAGPGFSGAGVTINGLTPPITSHSSPSRAVVVPQIIGAPAGPYSVPV